MSDDFLTQERIQRLQVMGVTVWQERGKRPTAQQTKDAHKAVGQADARPTAAQISTRPETTVSRAVKTKTSKPAQNTRAVADAPKPDASGLDWQQLRAAVSSCRACSLCETRAKTVFGAGNEHADVMIIGEGPGAEEERLGQPFAGSPGQLFDAMLDSVGMKRSMVFITGVVKCRSPGSRDPQSSEALQCSSYLQRQIELVKPKVLIAVGRVAGQNVLQSSASLAKLRSKVHHFGEHKVPCIVTYHPTYLMRSPDQKRKAWEDLLMSQKLLKEAQ